MKPPVQYAMMPPRVDAPKVGKMKPVQQPKVAKMRGIDEALDYYLGPTGIPDKLRAVNSMLNPVETLGGSMRASQKMLAPDTAPMDRVRYMGDMLSGVAGFVAPMVAAAKVGAPAASAVVDAFTGLSTAPATQAAKTTATDFAMKDGGALRYRRDASDIFGAGTTRAMYDDPATGGYMEMLERPNGPASTLELFVPEDMRGQGGGKRLLDEAMQNSPRMMGQVSSKAAAKTAYAAGRRPADMPNATLDDVFRMIDEDSSVNLVSPAELEARGILPPVAPMRPVTQPEVAPMRPSFKAYQGSPHNFPAERQVRYPDGRVEFISGQPDALPDVPAGATVVQDYPLGRMRMDKIGTGEGNQAYGHGIYTAQDEGIGQFYRDSLSDFEWTVNGKPYDAKDPEQFAAATLKQYPNAETALRDLASQNAEYSKINADYAKLGIAKNNDVIARIKAGGLPEITEKSSGKMYEVQINADPEAFLDWDKPLSEQPQAVRDALAAIDPDTYSPTGGDYDPQEPGQTIYQRMAVESYPIMGPDGRWGPGGATRDESLAMVGGDKTRVRTARDGTLPKRSEALRAKGVPGIKYLDAGSRTAGDGSRNYVVFDDAMIEILRKYGIAGLMMGGAGMMQPNQAQAGQ